jgi:type VI secretion system protein VasG
LRTIAATTWAEYKKHIEEDPALARRFQPVKLDEPSAEIAAVILRGLRSKYEEVHGVRIRDDAVDAAAHLSARYIAGRQLPDKAVDLMDTAAARVKIGLSSKPGLVEDLERKIQTLERELGAVERDRASGVTIDERHFGELTEEIAGTKDELIQKTEVWKRESEAVQVVIGLRDKIEGKDQGDDKPDGDKTDGDKTEGDKKPSKAELKKLTAELDKAMAALAEIQGSEPMIHIEMSPEVVAEVVGDWTGIPVGRMVSDAATSILQLEDNLKTRIKGQDHGMHQIAETIRAAKAGVGDPKKPIGVFLLAGPSGVGKTETALAVADLLFGGERFMTTINMSEYQDGEMGISGLVGARPGYVGYGKGGVLTEGVRQRPYSVVLLDEVEKAAQEVRNMFFQVFDKGTLTDGTGRDIDFKNTVIFVTSNVGLHEIQQLCAANPFPDPAEILTAVRPVLSKALTPAWLARTTVIPFLTLPVDALQMITKLKVKKIAKRVAANHRMEMVIDDKVTENIAERCTEVETGARNIDHILSGTLLPLISKEILQRIAEEKMPEKMHLGVDKGGGFTIEFS